MKNIKWIPLIIASGITVIGIYNLVPVIKSFNHIKNGEVEEEFKVSPLQASSIIYTPIMAFIAWSALTGFKTK